MRVEELIDRIRQDRRCRVEPNAGLPMLPSPSLVLPEDLITFYTLCGGASLYNNADFGFVIVPPGEFKPATPIVHRIQYSQSPAKYERDICSAWYLLARSSGPEENIVIDLHPSRAGKCYDGYVGTYASQDCKIIAASFTELLGWLLQVEGRELFWEPPISHSLGYAYEGMDIEPPCG